MRFYKLLLVMLGTSTLALSGCKTLQLKVLGGQPKQGDLIPIQVTVSEPNKLKKLTLEFNGKTKTFQPVPPYSSVVFESIQEFDTDKYTTGKYYTEFVYGAQAEWTDKWHANFVYTKTDLTVGENSREDKDLDYGIYIAPDPDDLHYTIIATGFIESINSMNQAQYFWANPTLFKAQAINYVNSVDLAIFIGHGGPHQIHTSEDQGDIVRMDESEFGNFVPAHKSGDLEYLVLLSCEVLKRNHEIVTFFTGGDNLPVNTYATSIAFGNVDSDPELETGLTFTKTQGSRFEIIDDKANKNITKFFGGKDWPKGAYPTCIAFGDVDGDGKDEVGVTCQGGNGYKYFVYDDYHHDFKVLLQGGQSWGEDEFATSIAFGNIDNDSYAEMGIAKKTNTGYRFVVLDDPVNGGFDARYTGGEDWGTGAYATSIAFGDVDGDGRDEIGVTRFSDANQRYLILDDQNQDFVKLHDGGQDWGSHAYATSISFGNVDNDKAMEVGITRYASVHERYWVLDDKAQDFVELHKGGNDWGASAHATSIAFGDTDADGRHEVAIGRKTHTNDRVWVLDDGLAGFNSLAAFGSKWPQDRFPTRVALGDLNHNSRAELGLSFYCKTGYRIMTLEDNPDDPTAFGARYPFFWFHNEATKKKSRAFSGLHMALGFMTKALLVSWGDNDARDFTDSFANKLDGGYSVINAYQKAVLEEMPMDKDENLSAVLYLKRYEKDTIHSKSDDVIYEHPDYNNQWIDYYKY